MKTGIIRATLNDLAKVLGLSDEEQASDALKSERAFKLSRRGLFVSAGALVAGKAFSIPNPVDVPIGVEWYAFSMTLGWLPSRVSPWASLSVEESRIEIGGTTWILGI